MSSGVSFASRASSSSSRRSSPSGTGTVKYGTVLSSGATASYPTSFASSPQYNPSSSGGGASRLSGGVIAGIVVACVAFLLLVAFVIFLLVMRRKRANKTSKRQSRTALLPAPNTSASPVPGQPNHHPDMAQNPNYASTGVTMPAAAAAPVNRNTRHHMVPGLSFGSGHRRTDSNNSTTPFLGAGSVPDSPSRPSTGTSSFEANRYTGNNRYSMESTTTFPGSPVMQAHDRFESPQNGSPRIAAQDRFGRSP